MLQVKADVLQSPSHDVLLIEKPIKTPIDSTEPVRGFEENEEGYLVPTKYDE